MSSFYNLHKNKNTQTSETYIQCGVGYCPHGGTILLLLGAEKR